VAHHRAVESERPDALFHDPLAKLLAAEKGPAIASSISQDIYTAWTVVIRTCIS
jgi:O-methyltransferase involved in polyketide biosynthesis